MKKNSNKNGLWLKLGVNLENIVIRLGYEIRLLFTYRTVVDDLERENNSLESQKLELEKKISKKDANNIKILIEKDDLILKLDCHIKNRNEIIRRNKEVIKKLNLCINELTNSLQETVKKLEAKKDVEIKLKNMRIENDSLASKIIQNEEEIKSLEERIKFLKENRRAPDLEEILAYEYNRKAVSKKIKSSK